MPKSKFRKRIKELLYNPIDTLNVSSTTVCCLEYDGSGIL